MVSGIIITTISAILISLWVRHRCLKLLRAGYSAPRRFSKWELRSRLRKEGHLDDLRNSLDREYRVFAHMMEHSPGRHRSVDHRMLLWDYRAMNFWYRLTRRKAPQQAHLALLEMASIVGFLASSLARNAAVPHNF
jgi:hypothetical protein